MIIYYYFIILFGVLDCHATREKITNFDYIDITIFDFLSSCGGLYCITQLCIMILIFALY